MYLGYASGFDINMMLHGLAMPVLSIVDGAAPPSLPTYAQSAVAFGNIPRRENRCVGCCVFFTN